MTVKLLEMECTANCDLRCHTPQITHNAACSCSPASTESTFVVTLLHLFPFRTTWCRNRLALSPDSQKVMGSNPRPFFVHLALSPCVCVGSLLVVWLIGILKLSVRCECVVWMLGCLCDSLSWWNWWLVEISLRPEKSGRNFPRAQSAG